MKRDARLERLGERRRPRVLHRRRHLGMLRTTLAFQRLTARAHRALRGMDAFGAALTEQPEDTPCA